MEHKQIEKNRAMNWCLQIIFWELVLWKQCAFIDFLPFVVVFVFFSFFIDWVSLCRTGYPGTCSVDHNGLKLRELPASAFQILGLRACSSIALLSTTLLIILISAFISPLACMIFTWEYMFLISKMINVKLSLFILSGIDKIILQGFNLNQLWERLYDRNPWLTII